MGILTNRVAVITGSGTGLGKATALRFAQEGASVVLCGRRQDKIEQVQKLIADEGYNAAAIQADISIEKDVQSLIKRAVAQYGKIDILINNAAVYEQGSVMDTSLETWNYHMNTNVTGAFLVTKECLAYMRKQQYGRIVNITSGLAANGAGGYAAYSASKAALESLTQTLAEDESKYDILVNSFNPGTVKSGMHATGVDPSIVTSDILKLASLPKHGMSGKLVRFGG